MNCKSFKEKHHNTQIEHVNECFCKFALLWNCHHMTFHNFLYSTANFSLCQIKRMTKIKSRIRSFVYRQSFLFFGRLRLFKDS